MMARNACVVLFLSVCSEILTSSTSLRLNPISAASSRGQVEHSAAAAVVARARDLLRNEFDAIDWRTQRHFRRILEAFRRQRVGSSELNSGLDGYAHGDLVKFRNLEEHLKL